MAEVLVEFAEAVTSEDGKNYTARACGSEMSDGRWQGKLLLKKMLEKYYPKAFLYRRKQGFSIPLETWFFNESGIKGDVKERLFSQNSGLRTYFDTKGIQALIDNRFVGPLWLLLVLDEWMDQSRRDRCH